MYLHVPSPPVEDVCLWIRARWRSEANAFQLTFRLSMAKAVVCIYSLRHAAGHQLEPALAGSLMMLINSVPQFYFRSKAGTRSPLLG